MKKLFSLLLASLLITSFAYAADVESGQVSELWESNYGRSVIYDESELITIWYEGSGVAEIGVSGSTGAGTLAITFYEDNIAVSETKFGGAATVDLDANDVEAVVNAINSDTSGEWKASIGRDATPGTSMLNVINVYPSTNGDTISTKEQDAWDNADLGTYEVSPLSVLREDASVSLMLRCGFAPVDRKTYRLKQFNETVLGTGTHIIKVWDGSTCVYRKAYSSLDEYNGTQAIGNANYIPGATPVTVQFTSSGSKGLDAHKGNGLVVTSEWGTSFTGDAEDTANLSIIVGEW